MEKEKLKIVDFIGEKATYDNYGQFIWGVSKDGGNQKLADLRGWGAIQNLFETKDGEIDTIKAASFQDELGEWIVDAINEKIERERIVHPQETPSIKGADIVIPKIKSDKNIILSRAMTYISEDAQECKSAKMIFDELSSLMDTKIDMENAKENIIQEFTANEIDFAYLTGVFNVSGIDGLHKEIQRLKQLGRSPHEIIVSARKNIQISSLQKAANEEK